MFPREGEVRKDSFQPHSGQGPQCDGVDKEGIRGSGTPRTQRDKQGKSGKTGTQCR